MSKFSTQTKANTKPPKIVVLSPDAFADTWSQKPQVEVAVGIRLISESDIQQARHDAARQAFEWYQGGEDNQCIDADTREEAYNDALLRFAVARATCDPNDKRQPYFEMAEETVRVALTSQGVARLWDELVQLHLGTGVAFAPADDRELRQLANLLRSPQILTNLSTGEQAEFRKLCAYCLEKILPFAPEGEAPTVERETHDEDEHAEDDGPTHYVARAAAP